MHVVYSASHTMNRVRATYAYLFQILICRSGKLNVGVDEQLHRKGQIY